MVANNALRLPDFDNEHVEIVSFDFGTNGKRSWQYPNRAEFLTGQTGVAKTAVVYLHHPEDHNAFSKAGFDLKGFEGQHNPPITVLIQKDRIASVKGIGGQWIDVIHSREDAPLHVVTNAMPAINPDNGDIPPAPLAFVEPEAPEIRRRGSDDGNGSTPTGKARLYAKMAQVMSNLKAIPKLGTNKQFNYKYVTDADLYDAVRTEMAKANIALLVRMKDVRKDGNMTLVDLDFSLCCGDTGVTETIRWTGSTQNPGDKAISAAVTVAEKYFLKATFIISTGDVADDPDSGVSEAEPQRSSGVSKRPAQPRQQAAPKAEAKPEATKSAPAGEGSAGNGHSTPPPAVEQIDDNDMPDDLFQKLMRDKTVMDASKVAPERANTIHALWREGALKADMDEFDQVMAVVERLQSHRKGGDK